MLFYILILKDWADVVERSFIFHLKMRHLIGTDNIKSKTFNFLFHLFFVCLNSHIYQMKKDASNLNANIISINFGEKHDILGIKFQQT